MNCAVYAGTFDPITLGHEDIVLRSLRHFDEVHVLIAVNGSKQTNWLSPEQRLEMLKLCFANEPKVKVVIWDNLLIDYLKKEKITVMIRGIRNATDLEHEQSLSWINSKLHIEVETFLLCARPEHSLISSSLVREMIRCGQSPSELVPSQIKSYLESKIV